MSGIKFKRACVGQMTFSPSLRKQSGANSIADKKKDERASDGYGPILPAADSPRRVKVASRHPQICPTCIKV